MLLRLGGGLELLRGWEPRGPALPPPPPPRWAPAAGWNINAAPAATARTVRLLVRINRSGYRAADAEPALAFSSARNLFDTTLR